MSVVKVEDLAYIRLQSPDLDQAEEFLTHLGLVRSARTSDRLHMRGTDPSHHLHVTHIGPPKYLGLAFWVDGDDDLKKLAQVEGASGIEHMDEPGGGRRVRLTDPHGYQIESVCGIAELPRLPIRRNVLNWGDEKVRRAGELMRLEAGPSQVKRIAHALLMTPRLREVIKWYQELFGFVCSDEIYAGSKDHVIATFNRCDRGEDFVDHHTFVCIESDKVGLNHVSFEVQNIDDVMLGHEHLRQVGKYEHVWGVGRHLLGSQVYDYWKDPWGRVHERWTDSDVLNCHNPTNYVPAERGLSSQWGDPVPQAFITHASP